MPSSTNDRGDKLVGARLTTLEADIDKLKAHAERWSLVWIAVTSLAILVPIGALASGLFTKGVDGAAGIDVPIGSVVAWPGPLPEPGDLWHDRWHLCDGKPVAFDERLWVALGGLYGNDAKGTAIQLPNFEGMFLRGAGEHEGHESEPLGKPQGDEAGPHDHPADVTEEDHAHGLPEYLLKDRGLPWLASSADRNYHDVIGEGVLTDPGSAHVDVAVLKNAAPETRPVNYAVHWVIRVK